MADVNHLAQIANLELDISNSSLLDYINEPEDAPTPPGTRTHQQHGAATARAIVTYSLTSPLRSSASFGSARTMSSNRSIQRDNTGLPAGATEVSAMDDVGRTKDDSSNTSSSNSFKYRKGVVKNSNKPGPTVSSPRARYKSQLSIVSEKYDLDGDGVLDEVEQAMRDRDKDGDGQLDNAEVYRIVQDQLQSQQDVHLYKKVAAGLVCLLAILSLSNLGTNWASAILAKDTVTDSESGTIQSKATGEVVGLQDVAFNYELDPLTEEEFEERRKLVEAEMMEDPDHEDHVHRRLGKKKKNHCTCSKIAYDHGKMRERDLLELTVKCDGVNSVSIKRKWRHNDGSEDVDYDTICGPGTVIVRKGKRKKNKHKTKVKVVDIKVTFRQKGKNGRDKSISFDCKRGYCYGSGGAILQREGHPCLLERDYDGAGECNEGLACYNSDGDTYGVGVCTNLAKYSRKDQVCNIDFGVNACISNYACYSRKNGRNSQVKVGTVRTGNCQRVRQRSGYNEVCDVSFGANACLNDYRCLGANGRDIGRVGIGFCTRSEVTVNNGRDGGWYVDYSLGAQGQCVNDGNAETWEYTWGTANECCEDKLSWMGRAQCVPGYIGWG
mmetsp:Transcript_31078/g.50754  ORF Transcript_31078/g.50754 Transcript_31078/m.50754 type:complete len:609 (-) Transcript_31078:196-2022(-)